jgi:RNA polymerase sigma-70 factor (ECF subfamily)
MDESEWLTRQFEAHRSHLRAVAYRMLGSLSEADDAVQEAWLRLDRTDTSDVENLGGWLTTVVGRICLNMLRSRTTRREDPLDPEVPHVPDPIVSRAGQAGRSERADPEHEVVMADSVGLALFAVLEVLSPAERLAFVLHDVFAVQFDEIAPIVGRSVPATRQLASRARRRVQGAAPTPDSDLGRQREVVDAFFAAARGGDFEALVAVLDPDIVLRADQGAPSGAAIVRGAREVAGQALMFADPTRALHPVLVNGAAGVVVTVEGRPVAVMGFTVADGRIVAIDALGDPDRLARLDLSVVAG